MMQRFAAGLDNQDHSQTLPNAIHGLGAFRYFKDQLKQLGLADAWYKFRDSEYRRPALAWCQENGVEVAEEA